jgi:hypothetical protein
MRSAIGETVPAAYIPLITICNSRIDGSRLLAARVPGVTESSRFVSGDGERSRMRYSGETPDRAEPRYGTRLGACFDASELHSGDHRGGPARFTRLRSIALGARSSSTPSEPGVSIVCPLAPGLGFYVQPAVAITPRAADRRLPFAGDARYYGSSSPRRPPIGRHGTRRVAKAVLIGAVAPTCGQCVN